MNSSEKFTASNRALFRCFDLSRNKSLRTLEITVESISRVGDTIFASDFLKTVLSSITSSTTLDIVIIYRDREICGVAAFSTPHTKPICFYHSSQESWARSGLYHLQHLKMFREMYKKREFRLVLCADVSNFMAEHAIEILQHVVDLGKEMGGLFHLYEPLVISERRIFLARDEYNPGCMRKWYIPASAL